uniref:Uncharacterized protein n=1 Tax=Ignisphaera aggregans TaxID=334771 RepID=A0A7C5UWL3_9CREN
MPKLTKIVKELLITWGISLALILLFSLFLAWDPIAGFGLYLALFSWWGWPLRVLRLGEELFMLLALAIPMAVAIVARLALEKVLRGFWVNLYISTMIYYIAGTIYYLIAPYAKPDIDVAISLLIWTLIQLSSCYITQNFSKHLQ